MVKKADVVLILCLLLAGFGGWFAVGFSQSAGTTVVITVDGAPYGSYPLDEDRRIPIDQEGAHNLVVLEGSTVRMEEANCAGRQCVYQGRIAHSGESIVCLPHRIVVEITGGGASYDLSLIHISGCISQRRLRRRYNREVANRTYGTTAYAVGEHSGLSAPYVKGFCRI